MDAAEYEQFKRDRDELARRAQAIRDGEANQRAAKTPGVLDKLQDMEQQIRSLREGLAAAHAAAGDDEEEIPQPRRRDHLKLLPGGREAG